MRNVSERSSTIREALAKSSPWHTAPSQGSLLLPLATEVSAGDSSRPSDPQNLRFAAVLLLHCLRMWQVASSLSFSIDSEHQADDGNGADCQRATSGRVP